MNIGLYFGSFNPIHNGHLHVANQALQQCFSDQVWFVVSPHNPFKESKLLADENQRLHMAQLACSGKTNLYISDIEFTLPRPSYTIDTIRALIQKHPEHLFHLIIGEDNLMAFDRWKTFDMLLELAELLVYPRTHKTPTLRVSLTPYEARIHFLSGELVDISATDIRMRVHRGESITDLTPPQVARYILENSIYR
jgi:nicotinate-nucleotide adenylyltransferase